LGKGREKKESVYAREMEGGIIDRKNGRSLWRMPGGESEKENGSHHCYGGKVEGVINEEKGRPDKKNGKKKQGGNPSSLSREKFAKKLSVKVFRVGNLSP